MSVTQTQIMVSPPSAPGSASVTKSKGSTEDKNNEKLMVRYFCFFYENTDSNTCCERWEIFKVFLTSFLTTISSTSIEH